MERKIFIDSVKDGALKGYADFRILPSLTIAQAILESGWATSKLSTLANNLFGIKAFSDWNGRRITLPTGEWVKDKMVIVNADFRAYDSFNDSIEDHNKLLNNLRYKSVRECTDYKEACEKIYKCGYATDPGYSIKLEKIIEENKLYEFDKMDTSIAQNTGLNGQKIRKFQKLCNELNIRDSEGKALIEDNILGRRTESCILRMPVLMMGSHGQAVKFVQECVGAFSVDGDFGPITKDLVMTFQRKMCILVDGIVGRETWRIILTT